MKQFLFHLAKKINSHFSLPFERRFGLALKAFSPRENQIFFTAMGVLVGTTIVLLMGVSKSYMTEVPTQGGTIVEGVLNTPAHINPLLATSEVGTGADRDLSMLIYSGLLRADGKNGYILDLAERFDISQNGLEYTFTLKPNLVWHDGKKISASDVVFTIKTAQDSRMKSPERANWDGVTVLQIDELTVRFVLKRPFPLFLENATLGILPEHIWSDIDYNRFDTNKYNREPIGSGPYKFKSLETVNKDGDEFPVSYTLTSFRAFALGRPYVDTIKFVFYKSEEALAQAIKGGFIDSVNGISPSVAQKLKDSQFRIEHVPLPRILSVFFNQTEQPLFSDISVRRALGLAIDRDAVIAKVLHGYGTKIDSPLPPGIFGRDLVKDTMTQEKRESEARSLLKKSGWDYSSTTNTWTKKVKKEIQTLQFELATGGASELKSVAEELKASWEKIGVPVTVQVYSIGDLKESIVRPRKFQSLFFGQVLGGGDPYPFWHSSQRTDPGLNITSYANAKVDKILEDARLEKSPERRDFMYDTFRKEILKDSPAIFMYSPEFIYVLPKEVKGVALGSITSPSERFIGVYKWYIHTDKIWKIFAD